MAFFSDILKKIKKPVDALKDFLTPKERSSLQEKEKSSPMQRIETKLPSFEYKSPSFEGLKSFASSFIPPKEAFKPIELAPRETPEERAARLEKARETTKKIVDFGKAVLRAGPRAAASVTLEAQGRRTMIPETKAEKFLFGQEPLESLTERVARFPERAKEFGIQEPTAKKIAPFAVLGLTALDILPPLPGKSGLKAVAKKALTTKTAKEFAKAVTKKEADQILKAGFKSVDDFFRVTKSPSAKASTKIVNELKAAASGKPTTQGIPIELESFVPKAGKHKDVNSFIREISGDTYAPEFRNPIADFWRKKYVQPLSKGSKATFTTDVVAFERNLDDVLKSKYGKDQLANMSVRQKSEIVNGKKWANLYGDMLENNLFKFQQDFFKSAKAATPVSPTAALKEAAGKTIHAKKLETGIDEAYRALEKTGKDEVYNLGKVGDYIADPKVRDQYKDVLDTPLYIKKQMHMGKAHGSLSVDPKGKPAIVLSDGLTKDMIDRTLVEELTHASQFKKGVRPTGGVPYKEIPEEIRAKKAAKHFAPKTTLEDLMEEAGLHRAKAKQFSNNDLEKEFVARQLGVAEGIEKAVDELKRVTPAAKARPTEALKTALKPKHVDPFELAKKPDYAKELRTSIGDKETILAHQEQFYVRPKRMKEGVFYHFTPDKKLTADGLLSGTAKRFDKQLGPGLYVGQDAQALKNFYGLDMRGGQAVRLEGNPKILDLTDSFKSVDDAHRAARKEFPKEKYPLGKWVQKQGYDGIKYFDPIATGEEYVIYNAKAFGGKPSEALVESAFTRLLFKDTTERGIKTREGLVISGSVDDAMKDLRRKLSKKGWKEVGGTSLEDLDNPLVKDGAELNFEKAGKALNAYIRSDGKKTALTFDETLMDSAGKLHAGDNYVPDFIKKEYSIKKPIIGGKPSEALKSTSIAQMENESAIAELKAKFKNIEQRNVPILEIRNFPSAEGREIVENAKKEILAGKKFPLVLEQITEGKNAGKYKVIDGNYRAQAYKELGIKEAPAITQSSKVGELKAAALAKSIRGYVPEPIRGLVSEAENIPKERFIEKYKFQRGVKGKPTLHLDSSPKNMQGWEIDDPALFRKEGAEKIESIKKDILAGKEVEPVYVNYHIDKTGAWGEVMDGHHRLVAFQELGRDIPVIFDNLSLEKIWNFANKGMYTVSKKRLGAFENLAGMAKSASAVQELKAAAKTDIPKIKDAKAIDLSQPAKAAQPSKIQEIIGEYQKRINTTPAKKAATPITKTLDDTYTAIIDRFHPITKLARKAADLRPGENPELLARRYLGIQGIAESKLFWNTTRLTAEGNLEVTGPGLSKILKPAKNNIDDLRTLMIAERDIELSTRTLESGKKVVGTTPKQSKEVINALKQKYGGKGFEQLSKTALGVRDWSRKALLDPLLEVGAISKEQYDTITKSNKFYVPFQRVIEELETHGFVPKKANIFSPRSVPVKKLKGSTKDIIDPFESMITNAYKVTDFVERARVGRSITNLRNTSPELAEMIKPIKPKLVPVAKQGEELIFRPSFFTPDKNTIMVFENGKRKFYQVPEDVFKAVSGMMESDVGAIMKVLAFPARTLRAGATLTPEFMGRNPLRDQLTAFVFSKYGYVPGVDLAKGIFNTVGKTDLHGRWLAGGGAHSMLVSLDRVTSQATLAKVLGSKDIKGMVKNPLEALRMLSEFGEKGTRVGAFGRAVKKGVNDLEAAFESRDITLDFARRGSQTRAVNMLVAFWNAQVQGLNKLVRAFRERPMQTTFKAASGITLPSVLLYLNNRNDPRYQELPQWQKDLFWILPIGDKGPIIRIPKPFEVGIIFGTVPEHILTWLDKNDPEALTSAAKTLMEASAPGYIPTGLQPIIENVANYSFFRQRPLVSEGKQALPKELQADRYTSETAREVGKLIKQSPAKIENLFVSYTGGLGKYALDASDKLLKTLGVVSPPSEPTKTLADRPFLRAFVAREPIGSGSESVNKFYKLYDEANATKAAVKGLAEEGKEQEAINYLRSRPAGFYTKGLNKVARTFSDLRKKRDAVLDSRELNPEQKKRAIDALDKIMTEIARQTVELVRSSNEKIGQ